MKEVGNSVRFSVRSTVASPVFYYTALYRHIHCLGCRYIKLIKIRPSTADNLELSQASFPLIKAGVAQNNDSFSYCQEHCFFL